MASDTGRGSGRVGARTSSRTPVDEKIVPNSGWTEDSAGHCLLVDLPGFRKEEVKLEVDDSGHIIVRGERLTNEQNRVRFELTFPLPFDSDMDKIAGNFDSEILYVYVPKLSSQENKERHEIEEAANGNVESPEEIESEEPFNADNEGRDHSQQYREREKEQRKNEKPHMEGFSEEVMRKWGRETGMSRGAAVEVLRRNKGIVITAVIAFSFGLYVSHKFQSLTTP